MIVFDAADLHAESAFWAGVLGDRVVEDADRHSVVDDAGHWRVGVRFTADHSPPDRPDGRPRRIHLDLHVDDPAVAHVEVIALGARLLRAGDLDLAEGHQAHADPAGHPSCIGWGHPSRDEPAAFTAGN